MSSTIAQPPRRRYSSQPLLPIATPHLLMILAIFASGIAVLASRPDVRLVLAPMLTIVLLALFFVAITYNRDRELPVFELATYWVVAAALYGGFPLLNFLAGGLKWPLLADGRIRFLDPGAEEIGAFGWRYAVHMVAFLVVYLPLRKTAPLAPVESPGKARIVSIVLIYVSIIAFLTSVGTAYDVSYSPSYDALNAGEVKSYASLPSNLLQMVHNLVGMRMLCTQMLIAILLMSRRFVAWAILAGGIGVLAAYTIVLGTARSTLFILVVTVVMLVHRLIRRISLTVAVPAATAVFAMFMALGMIRDSDAFNKSTEYNTPLLASANEFQSVFTTAFDLQQARRNGLLPDIPWQVHWSDFTFLVPSQLLPFEKIDPAQWYLDVMGYEFTGGFMFGVMAQAVLGLDWLELAIRGALVALFCAAMQRWYIRRSRSFWATIFMLFLALWMYYSLRLSSFAFLYFIVYRFLPAMVTVEVLAWLLRDTRRRFLGGLTRR